MRFLLLCTAALLLLLSGCCTPERVVLLPQADGRPSALIVQRHDKGSQLVLAEPYAQASVDSRGLNLSHSDAARVQRDFGALLQFQPQRPRVFSVNFLANSDQLTPETEPVLAELGRALAELPAGELIVIGHTDRVGSVEANDRLSLQRAQVVAALLERELGVPHDKITVVGRGEREPLIPTEDEVDEPRNRRVEIKLR